MVIGQDGQEVDNLPLQEFVPNYDPIHVGDYLSYYKYLMEVCGLQTFLKTLFWYDWNDLIWRAPKVESVKIIVKLKTIS